MSVLDELIERIGQMDDKKRAELAKEVMAHPLAGGVWVPNPGAQTDAYFSEADVLGFGGEAGPGKTDLVIGLSLTAHKNSLILRHTHKEASGLIDRYEAILGHRNGLNTGRGYWRLPGRTIEYGGCEHEKDKQKYKGKAHDLLAFDEVVDFPRETVEFLMIWNRPASDPKQRSRVVMTFNPPTQPVGYWVYEYFGPWLDKKHPNPAEYGELRWFTNIDGKDTEVDGRGPHIVNGEEVYARSRTFIQGHLKENILLKEAGYDATRAAAPKGFREAYKLGDFEAALADVPGQLIPSAWVRLAQDRWTSDPPQGIPMCAMGVDATGGGDDPLTIAMRHDGWFAPIVEIDGRTFNVERMGAEAAAQVFSYRKDAAPVAIDMGGGYGGQLLERLTDNKVKCFSYKGAEKSTRRTVDRKLGFVNRRAELWWKFREALDPEQPGGSPIALPPDPKLFADLTVMTFSVMPNGIALETKEKVKERLGRSTDHGDCVVMCWSCGDTYQSHGGVWREMKRALGRPKVTRSYENRKRRWR